MITKVTRAFETNLNYKKNFRISHLSRYQWHYGGWLCLGIV